MTYFADTWNVWNETSAIRQTRERNSKCHRYLLRLTKSLFANFHLMFAQGFRVARSLICSQTTSGRNVFEKQLSCFQIIFLLSLALLFLSFPIVTFILNLFLLVRVNRERAHVSSLFCIVFVLLPSIATCFHSFSHWTFGLSLSSCPFRACKQTPKWNFYDSFQSHAVNGQRRT